MANGSNLKAKVGMDTGDFEKGAKRVTKAAQSMGKDIGTSLTDVGRAIGVDAGLLGDLAGRIQNATTLFKGMASAGGNAASSLTKAMTGLGGAIAGLGITAAVVTFKELNKQAEYFEQRMQGVNLAASAKAYRDTYAASLYESSGAGGAWANFKEKTKNYFATNLAEIGTFFWAGSEDRAKAKRDAKEAAQLASERVDIQRRLDASVESQARFQKEINAQLLIARDRSQSSAERKAAEARAVELINQKYDEQLSISTALRDNMVAMGALTGNTDQENREIAQANANLLTIEAQRTQELTSMVRLENQITGVKASQASSAKATQQATELTLAAATELVKQERALKAIQDQNDAMKAAARFRMDGALPGIETPSNLQASANALTVPALIKPVVDAEAAKLAMIDLTDTVLDSAMSMSEALGGLIGGLLTGGDAWGNFTSAALSSFADLAISVGKMAVATGAATAGIKAALESLNPYVAMAAGAALIALGAAVKSGMANLASGGYASAPSVASSSYSSGSLSAGSVAQTVNVRVTGTLTGEGSKLKAVLNNENTRLATTT